MDLMNLELLSSLGPFMYSIVGAFFGDLFILIIGFLQSQELINNFWPCFFAFMGLYLSDVLFYFIGRSKYFEGLKKTRLGKKIIPRANATIDFLTGNNLIVALFYSKFVSGVKLIMNVYLGEKKVPLLKFLYLNFLMAVFWTIIAWSIGYLAGESFLLIVGYFESLSLGILGIILVIALLFNLSKRSKKYISQKYN